MSVIFFLVLRSLAEPPFFFIVLFASVLFIIAYARKTFRRNDLLFIHVSVSLSAALRLRFSRFGLGLPPTGTGQNSRIYLRDKKNTAFNIFEIKIASIPRLEYFLSPLFSECLPGSPAFAHVRYSIPRHRLVAT